MNALLLRQRVRIKKQRSPSTVFHLLLITSSLFTSRETGHKLYNIYKYVYVYKEPTKNNMTRKSHGANIIHCSVYFI